MIRLNCPHCEYAQEFPDESAGTDAPCGWCGEPFTVGGPAAEFVPTGGRGVGWVAFAVGLVAALGCVVGWKMLETGELSRVSLGLLFGGGAIAAVLGRVADRLLRTRSAA